MLKSSRTQTALTLWMFLEVRMKKLLLGAVIATLFAFMFVSAPEPVFAQAAGCAKIKDGSITASTGETLTQGYDQYGYNYQAHMFNGTYDSVDRTLDGKYWGSDGDYTDDSLIMKWSDNWLSNLDCNGDHKLDRDGNTGISKGWTTNLVEGDYLDGIGDSHHYTYFVKIVFDGGVSCQAGESTCLWGLYAIVEEIYNDPFGGYHGVDHSRLTHPGLGRSK
jgi:hypothetical protein